MRILQLGKFYPIRGGVEKVEYDLMMGLSELGVDCDMMCALSEGGSQVMTLNENARLIGCRTWMKLAATMIAPEMIFSLRKRCQEYDVIHIHVSSTVGYSFKYLEKWQASGFVGAKGCKVKHAEIWEEISEKSNGKTLEMHINERNGYRNWLTNECDMRGRKHGFIL